MVRSRLANHTPPRQPITNPYREGDEGRPVAPRAVAATPADEFVLRQATGGRTDKHEPGAEYP